MEDDVKTLILGLKPGEKILFKLSEEIVLDLYLKQSGKKGVTIALRVSDKVRITKLKAPIPPDHSH